jgi:hypothetical protein
MPYEDYSGSGNQFYGPFVEENKKIIGVVTTRNQQNVNPVVFQRPMLLPLPVFQQNQAPFPLLFFLFPRIAMLLSMLQGGGFGPKRFGVQNITQITRDSNGYIKEIVEFVK